MTNINVKELDLHTKCLVYEKALDIAARQAALAPFSGPIEDTVIEDLVEGWKNYWMRDILISMFGGN